MIAQSPGITNSRAHVSPRGGSEAHAFAQSKAKPVHSIAPVPRRIDAEARAVNFAAATELDSRKESHSDMNDWLNVLVQKRIAKATANGETLPPEMAWVAEHDHQVYVKRFKPLVWVVLALCAFGLAQTTQPLALVAIAVFFYFYIDFYSGVLHVVLDNPQFVKLPLIGVPCVEFQWHHTFPFDISTTASSTCGAISTCS